MKNSKKDTIKQTLLETRQRRKFQTCKVYELKLDLSHLSTGKLNNLNNLFKEVKWLYNHTLATCNSCQDETIDIFKFNPLIKFVNILDQNKQPIVRKLSIGSQIKQATHSRMLDSIKALYKN